MRHQAIGVLAPLTALVAPLAFPCAAAAFEGEVTSDTTAQFYDVRSPTGETVLPRRRITTTLGVSAYDLLDSVRPDGKAGAPLGPELLFRARMRYDADFGASPAETDVTNYGRLVPAFERGPVDLMYGYVEGRRYLHGWLGFKLGRQYVTDALGWYAFDGGEVRVTTPFFVAAEAYAGLEVRGGMPLSTPRFERDGVWRGDRTGYDPTLYPSFQASDVAPVVGAALESVGVTWIHGRLSYRHVTNTGDAFLSPFASPLTPPTTYGASRLSQERVGYAMDASLGTFANARAGIVYDAYTALFPQAYASVDAFVGPKVTVGLDYDYDRPTYDADSIWNFFVAEPMNDVTLRGTVVATDRLSVSASANVRIFTADTSAPPEAGGRSTESTAGYPTTPQTFDEGGTLSARYRWGEGSLGFRGAGNFGHEGGRIGGDLFAERVLETRYILEARASAWHWDDRLRPGRDAMSVGYVLGAGYRFTHRSQALFELEHNVNRLVGQRLRALVWLTVAVLP